MKPGRNDPCPCGSGKKFKHCCEGKTTSLPKAPTAAELSQLRMLLDSRRYPELESRARSTLSQYPDSGLVWELLGMSLQMQGKDALAAFQKTAELLPNDAGAQYNLGAILKSLGKFEEAAASYRRAIRIKPGYAEAYNNLGNIMEDLGQFDDALSAYRSALKINPGIAEAHLNLGVALSGTGQLNNAVASYQRAIQLNPNYAEAYNNLGTALKDLGKIEDAITCFRQALKIKTDYINAYSNLLFLHGYQALLSPEQYLAQARQWEQACIPEQARQAARHKVFQRSPLNGRRLKVGYVSGDYRQHAVSYFVEQLFTHHDRSRIELFAYTTQHKRDAVTVRLQSLAEHWVSLAGMSDHAALARIGSDNIDVLIDLSGHTAHNRLGIFAQRAAPIQAYYLGYFASTGLSEMDYWIGDEMLTPPETDSHFSEQVWRLPRVSWSYNGKDAPPSNWQPSPDGTLWLGSFNNLGKLTPLTFALWAKALHALPNARLLLKTKELTDVANRQRILAELAGHGISPERIELQDSIATPDWHAHMAYYDRLDIALDPVGSMGGVTTSCDALWMGVPVITKAGDRVTSRATASILHALNHPEWVAQSNDEYVEKIVTLAENIELRRSLRAQQRSLMLTSPLCDARGLATALENAYVDMFQRRFK